MNLYFKYSVLFHLFLFQVITQMQSVIVERMKMLHCCRRTVYLALCRLAFVFGAGTIGKLIWATFTQYTENNVNIKSQQFIIMSDTTANFFLHPLSVYIIYYGQWV